VFTRKPLKEMQKEFHTDIAAHIVAAGRLNRLNKVLEVAKHNGNTPSFKTS
jgi:hypothetical protein